MPRIPLTHSTRENLAQFVHWIPWITLVKNHLASWHKKRVHDGEELRSAAPVEKVHCNHIVEVPTRKRAEKVGGRQKLYFLANTGRNLGTLLKCHHGNWVFPSRNSQERVCEQTFPTAELENGLPRQRMNDLAVRLGRPHQTIRGHRIMLAPIDVEISLRDHACRSELS